MTTPPQKALPLRHAALGMALMLACLVLAALALRVIGERTLRGGAEQFAQSYVRFLRDTTPGLPRLIEAGELDEATRDQLARARRVGEVYRFKVFDREGRLLLASDDLDANDPLTATRDHAPRRGGSARAHGAPAEALAGDIVSVLRSGSGEADRPLTYVEVYVPWRADGRVAGLVEVYLDQSARQARLREAFGLATLVMLALALVLGGMGLAYLANQRDARRRSDARARWLVEHDALTGALNRAGFAAALGASLGAREDASGSGPAREALAVLCIDLDRFRPINEAHGAAAGDAVLRECTRRLRGLLERGDALARVGADEYALLHHGATDEVGLARLAQRVVDALGEPFEIAGRAVHCGASVGAVPVAADAVDLGVEAVLRQADAAMARAKRAGGGRFAFYDADAEHRVEERRLLAEDLRSALHRGELLLHYQPLFDREGRVLLGYEALMRWRHPVRGMVPPSEFIPLAEETGLIEALGAWALREACVEAARWPGAISVAVNLSAAQFHGRIELPALVAECLADSGLPPTRLVLEITESLLMSDTDSVVRTLQALSRTGVSVAMDDFGTGYSSLGSLWRFPFSKVKIDRAFVKDLVGDERVALIVRSIVSLAHSLAMRVTAEGVETAAQAALLARLGCDELQGYLLGRPAPAPALDHAEAVEAVPEQPTAPHWDELATRPAPL
ncbi:MAG TPA: bifunctional diguanylate cyclase/phosphodiesterase [Burkholderiaceae bacterium]|nr:bifunctional diguanylate cyclase/phosphodiesterase [Burkholderiaceae bacterium]